MRLFLLVMEVLDEAFVSLHTHYLAHVTIHSESEITLSGVESRGSSICLRKESMSSSV